MPTPTPPSRGWASFYHPPQLLTLTREIPRERAAERSSGSRDNRILVTWAEQSSCSLFLPGPCHKDPWYLEVSRGLILLARALCGILHLLEEAGKYAGPWFCCGLLRAGNKVGGLAGDGRPCENGILAYIWCLVTASKPQTQDLEDASDSLLECCFSRVGRRRLRTPPPPRGWMNLAHFSCIIR